MRRWFKFWMRKRSKPISVPYSRKMKENLAVLYCFFAWNSAALTVYYTIKNSYPMTEKEKKESAHYYARLWQTENLKVINVDGFKVRNIFEIKEKPKLNPDLEEFLPEPKTSIDGTPVLED